MEKGKLIALVQEGQSGDTAALEKLLMYAHTSVSYQCRKMLNNAQDAEDMTQEVLFTIYTKLDTLQEPAAFNKWVNQITASRCINVLNRTHVEYQFAEDEEGHSILDNLEELDEQRVPDKALDNAETARMIEEIVDELPDVQRAATLMFYYNEMSVKEIAKTMQVSENTVKSRLNYARKAIKEKVLDYEKQGVKLYGLSPLPFMLYFLRLAAQNSANKKHAAAMVAEIMASNTAAIGAAGTSASVAGKVAGSSAAGIGAAAGGGAATSAAGATATGIIAGFSVKAAAAILAGIVTIGGIAVGTYAMSDNNSSQATAAAIETTLAAESTPAIETEVPATEVPATEVPATEAPMINAPTEPEVVATFETADPVGTEPAPDETQPAHACSYSQEVIDPTCTEKGYTIFTCECGESYRADETQAIGHQYKRGSSYAYRCYETGYITYTCANCGDSYQEVNPNVGSHRYSVETDLIDCELGGTVTYTCEDCGDTYQTEITKEHNYNDEGVCIKCGKIKNSSDNESTTETETAPAEHSHEYTVAEIIDPTCTEDGYTIYKCECGASYVADKTEAAGHNYVDEVVKSTMETDGYTLHTCQNCGDSYKDNIITAHLCNYVCIESILGETCASDTYHVYNCALCNDSYIVYDTPRPEIVGHFFDENGVCTNCGYAP